VIGTVKEQGIDDGSVTELDMRALYQQPYIYLPFSPITIRLCQAHASIGRCVNRYLMSLFPPE